LNLTHLVIFFILLFNIIRSIYFFLIPSGNQGPILDYILVVLPTLLYFTAFSLVTVAWAVATVNSHTNDFPKRLRITALSVNAAMYLMLIILVLVFQFGASYPEQECTGRVDVGLGKAYQIKKAVSIFYAVAISFVSLLIGASFLFFGARLWPHLQMSAKKRSSPQKRIMELTAVCSASFILHCAFILIATGLSKPNIIFSFVGLITTEIFPTLFLAMTFEKMRKSSKRNSSSDITTSPESNRRQRFSSSEIELSSKREDLFPD